MTERTNEAAVGLAGELRERLLILASEWVEAERRADEHGPGSAYTGHDCAEMLRDALADCPMCVHGCDPSDCPFLTSPPRTPQPRAADCSRRDPCRSMSFQQSRPSTPHERPLSRVRW